jgi:uncharacterized protein (TIGR03083 family)
VTLSRAEISTGLIDELGDFGRLVSSVDDQQWTAPTRCTGWTVADVSAHLIGSMTDVTQGRLDGLGSPEVTARQVDERRGRTAAELFEELAGAIKASTDMMAMFDDAAWDSTAPGGYDGTLGQGVEALWYDAYLHADDIRSAIGMTSERGPGLRASVHHVAAQLEQAGWGPATLAFDGIEPVPVSDGGPEVRGDALEFVLTVTGRRDPATTGFEVPNIYAE